MSGPEAGELVELARLVLAESDRRDAEMRAREVYCAAARAEGFREGLEAGRAQAEADLLAEIALEKRLQVGIVRALAEAAPPRHRWHLCCPPCRRAGHRPGCRDCQERTRETFADPMPGDYQGGPVQLSSLELVRGVA